MNSQYIIYISIIFFIITIISIIIIEVNKKYNNNLDKGYKWPLKSPPSLDQLDKFIKYETEPLIGNKILITEDTDKKLILYFENNKIKNDFIENVKKYDFTFYYSIIQTENNNKQDIYFIPNEYIHLNLLSNKKPKDTKYNLGLILTSNTNNTDKFISKNMTDLYNHITSNNLYWNNNNIKLKFIKIFDEYSYKNSLVAQVIKIDSNLDNKESYGYLYINNQLKINLVLTKEFPNDNDLINTGVINSDYNIIKFDNNMQFNSFIDYKYKIGNNYNILKYNTVDTLLSSINTTNILYPAYYKNKISIEEEKIINYKLENKINKIALNKFNKIYIMFDNDHDEDYYSYNNLEKSKVLIFGYSNESINKYLYLLYVPKYINLDYSYDFINNNSLII